LGSNGACNTCGVPRGINKTLRWDTNGTITETRDPGHRMVLADVEGINQLFDYIESLVGISLESIIIESKAKATKRFTQHLIRGPKGTLLRLVGLDRAIDRAGETARMFGYGQFNIIERDWKNNLVTWHMHDPYCVPLMCGDLRGATEAIRNVTGDVTYQKLAGGSYFVRANVRPRPTGLEERLLSPEVRLKPGDLTYETCKECGLPAMMSDFVWDMDKGITTNTTTGLRFAFVGPDGLQVVFDELQSELGDTVPGTVIEAQRRRTANSEFDPRELFNPAVLRRFLGILGFGNLVELADRGGRYYARVENPALPYIIVGTALGVVDAMTGANAHADWSIDDGDLELTVTPGAV
jgi:hypothetical protein